MAQGDQAVEGLGLGGQGEAEGPPGAPIEAASKRPYLAALIGAMIKILATAGKTGSVS